MANDKAKLLDDSEFIIVHPKEFKKICIDHAHNSESVGVIGPPGCGKTEIVCQVADIVGKPALSPFNCVLSDGVDMKGIPSFNHDKTSVTWVKDKRWLTAVEIATTILADELGQGNTGSMNSMASVIQEKRVDDVYLHPDTWVVWTGNRQQDKCGTTRIPAHIYNRSYMYELAVSAQDHIEYEIVREDTDILTCRYLRMKGDTAYTFDPARIVNATARAWSVVARKLFQNPDTTMPTIAGRIGRGLATELMAFRKIFHTLPPQEEVLLKPKEARVPEEISAQFLITDMLADIASANNFGSLVTYIKRMTPDMQAKFVSDAMQRHPEVVSTRAFTEWGVKFAEILR